MKPIRVKHRWTIGRHHFLLWSLIWLNELQLLHSLGRSPELSQRKLFLDTVSGSMRSVQEYRSQFFPMVPFPIQKKYKLIHLHRWTWNIKFATWSTQQWSVKPRGQLMILIIVHSLIKRFLPIHVGFGFQICFVFIPVC